MYSFTAACSYENYGRRNDSHSGRGQINKENRVNCCQKVNISRVTCMYAIYISLRLRAWCISKQGGIQYKRFIPQHKHLI